VGRTVRDVIQIVAGLSTEVKFGWAIWLVWGIFLLEWYWRGRGATPAPHSPPPDKR
jgi:hypothetical protein